MYGALVSGWALVAYFTQIIYENIQPLLLMYQKYVLIYALVTSALSFAVCFYIGPPKNTRVKQLIKWSLQIAALVSVYFSSDLKDVIISIMVALVLMYFFPKNKLPVFGRMWTRLFPPKPKLLTKEEFEEQGRIETEKALKELREYVRSPNCKQWKVVMNLSQPSRFASFVEGDHHITHDETLDYENTINDLSDVSIDSDSSNNSSEIDESIAVDSSLKIINKSKIKKLNDLNNFGKNSKNNSLRNRAINNTIDKKKFTRNGSAKKNQLINNYEMSEESD
jgi:NEMP family